MANKVMTHYYVCWHDMLDNKPKDQKTADYFKTKYGCTFRSIGYRYLSKNFPESASYLRRDIATGVDKDFQADLKNGLLRGERSLRAYRRGTLPLHNQDMHLRKDTEEEYVLKWIKGIEFAIVFGRDKSNNKVIVDRIISGDYKLSGSKIINDWQKKKWFLFLCFNMPERDNELKDDVAVGVDLGIAVPAVCALNQGKSRAFIGNTILLKR